MSHDYQVWKALGLVLRGVTAARMGRHAEGLALCEQGIKQYENLRSPPIFWPLLLSLRAEAFARAAQQSTALELLDQATELAGGDNWVSGVLWVQKGMLLASMGSREAAVRLLLEAFDEGERIGTITLQLRAATALARLNGSEPGSAERLRRTLARFTEGFDTPLLRDAQSALDDAAE